MTGAGRRLGAALVAALGLAVALASPAAAQQTAAEAAEAATARLDAAAVRLSEADSASDRIAALTDTVRAYEDGLAALREGLRAVALREAQLQADLDARRDEIAALLATLQTMGRAPVPALLLHPDGPTGSARAAMIVSDVTPALQAEAADLAQVLEELAVLRAIQSSAIETLQSGLDGAEAARARLAEAMQDRTDLPTRYVDDPVQTALLIASTETLAAFAGSLAEDPQPPEAAAPRPGSLALPVQGRVIRTAGQPDAAGTVRPGILVATRPRALVTAPTAATVRYRGELLDLGNVVILEPAAEMLIVLSGLAEVFVQPGEVVQPGAALGLMGGSPPSADGMLTDRDLRLDQSLYIEVRKGEDPVDPLDWFGAP